MPVFKSQPMVMHSLLIKNIIYLENLFKIKFLPLFIDNRCIGQVVEFFIAKALIKSDNIHYFIIS